MKTGKLILAITLIVLTGQAIVSAQGTGMIAVTVNVLKKTPGKFVSPEVRLLENGDGCTFRTDDGWTSETPSEFYFTVNVPAKNVKAPVVLVNMKGLEVRRVIMPGVTDARYEITPGGLKIELVKRSNNIRHLWSSWTDQERTDVQFPWNWTERRDGRYRDPEPLYENRNLAHMAYALGAREIFREWDITSYLEKNFPGKGDAAAIGYENNFPQQHEDYPPHVHIWFKWPDWRGYNTHIYMDDNGQITGTWIITPKNERYYPKAGVWQAKNDDEERTVFWVRYTKKGTVEMKKTGKDPVFALRIKPGEVNTLTVLKKNKPVKTVKIAVFDPVNGKMVVETCDIRTGKMRIETLAVDPDLAGGKREIVEQDCR